MSYLLDTNVLSEVRKGETGQASVIEWYRDTEDEDLHLSVMVVGEIRKGIEKLARRSEERASEIEEWLGRMCAHFGNRILPVNLEVASEWGRISADESVPAIDGLLAATARINGLIVVTRNTRDIERTGVPFLNPFD